MFLKASALTFNGPGHLLKIRTKTLSYYLTDFPTHLKSHISIKRTVYPKIRSLLLAFTSFQTCMTVFVSAVLPLQWKSAGPKTTLHGQKMQIIYRFWRHFSQRWKFCYNLPSRHSIRLSLFQRFCPTVKANGVHTLFPNNTAWTIFICTDTGYTYNLIQVLMSITLKYATSVYSLSCHSKFVLTFFFRFQLFLPVQWKSMGYKTTLKEFSLDIF